MSYKQKKTWLTLNMQLANSADVKLIYFFLFFLVNRILHSMQIVSLHEVSDPIFYENKKKIFQNEIC